MQLVYCLPVHNEQAMLAENVARLRAYLDKSAFAGAVISLLENGSSDASWTIAQELAKAPGVFAFREERAGLGYAYHRGLSEAVAQFGGSTEAWAILTAADLPFGTSDLEAAAPHLGRPPIGDREARRDVRIMMGSKAHPDSEVTRAMHRDALTAVYRVMRRAVLGMRVGDSQGSVFLRLDLVQELVGKVESRDFFYTTELCHYAERAGDVILELPVRDEGPKRQSTVRPFKHGARMLAQMWALRGRERSAGRARRKT